MHWKGLCGVTVADQFTIDAPCAVWVDGMTRIKSEWWSGREEEFLVLRNSGMMVTMLEV